MVAGIFLDIKKAFNSVHHSPLLDLLCSLNFPLSFSTGSIPMSLTVLKQSVVLNGISSAPKIVSSGVPQGSILGPLLYILYINGVLISSALSTPAQYYMPMTCSFTSPCIDSFPDYSPLQTKLNYYFISDWLSFKLFNLKPSKSKFMFFSHKPPPQDQINDLQCVPEFQYLGIILNQSLSWSRHIMSKPAEY